MIISRITGGIGNQLFQYAAGRRLANRLNTEFKLDITLYQKVAGFLQFALNQFNITAKIATPEEVKSIIERRGDTAIIKERDTTNKYNIWNCPDDTYVRGYWEKEIYFADIAQIIREEFTLKNPLSPEANQWKNKILSAKCSVSMHFRHGDFVYNPNYKNRRMFAKLPIDYYYECINKLKQLYKNITVFVFSDSLQWSKDNLQLDVPIEFVEYHREKNEAYQLSSTRDVEDLYLMSLCNHNIIANSTFSFWGAWLNQNTDKKVFLPIPSSDLSSKKSYRGFSAERNENSSLQSDIWIRVPFDIDNQPEIKMPPIFSLLLVVNNDANTIAKTLENFFSQDYKYYEVIIIDNASTDGSSKICRQAIKDKENVTYKRLRKKISNVAAWNKAFKMTKGYYVSFLKVNDRFLINAFSTIYIFNERRRSNIIQFFSWLEEDENGTVTVGEKKYSEKRDAFFQKQTKPAIMSANGQSVAKLLLSQQINRFLGTKIFNCDFLKEKGIKFDENLSDEEAELFFQIECFFKSKYFMHVANALYIAPRK